MRERGAFSPEGVFKVGVFRGRSQWPADRYVPCLTWKGEETLSVKGYLSELPK